MEGIERNNNKDSQRITEIELNTATVADRNMRLDTNSIIPVWKKGTTEKEEIQCVRNYIRDIRRIQALRVVSSDPLLINASLVKSGRTYLYEELPKEAESSIDGFVAYLQTAYGLTAVDMLKELHEIEQGSTENPYSYLSRLCNQYYKAHEQNKKTLAEAEKSTERAEIMSLYLNGLNDPRVRRALKMDQHTLTLETLPMRTLNIVRALQAEKSNYEVNNLERYTEASEASSDDEHVEKVNNPTRNERNPRQFSERRRYMDRKTCYDCGSMYHIRRYCPLDVICHQCNQEGRFSRECPKRPMRVRESARDE